MIYASSSIFQRDSPSHQLNMRQYRGVPPLRPKSLPPTSPQGARRSLSKTKAALIDRSENGGFQSKEFTYKNVEETLLTPRRLALKANQNSATRLDIHHEYIKEIVASLCREWKVVKTVDIARPAKSREPGGVADPGSDSTSSSREEASTKKEQDVDNSYAIDRNDAGPLELNDYIDSSFTYKQNSLISPSHATSLADIETADKSDPLVKLLHTLNSQRLPIFDCFPVIPPEEPLDLRNIGKPFTDETPSKKIIVTCDSFEFQPGIIEPFYFTMALYDIERQEKVSENFEFNFNHLFKGSLPDATGKDPMTSLSMSKTAVFDIPEPSDALFLVISVSRVIQGEDGDKEFMKYCTRQEEMKASEITAECATRVDVLGRFKELFAFEAIQLFTPEGKQKVKGNISFDKIKLIKFERDILELVETIADDVELMLKKFKYLPGKLNLRVGTYSRQKANALEGRVTPSYVKVRSTQKDSTSIDDALPVAKEIAPFVSSNVLPFPSTSYVANLYFYPEGVNFRRWSNTQKGADVNARTIAVEISYMSSDSESGEKLCDIYGRAGEQDFVSSTWSHVQYHNQKPFFIDEIKIRLPSEPTPGHHLRLAFYHVKCELGKNKVSPETLLAYTYIPLFPNGRLVRNGTYNSPLFFDLPQSYLASPIDESLQYDHGKDNFAYTVKTISSVHLQDDLLEDLLEASANPITESEPLASILNQIQLKSLNTNLIITHMNTLIDALLRIICNSTHNFHKLQSFVLLVGIVDLVFSETASDCFLESYLTYHFEPPASPNSSSLPLELVNIWLKYIAIDNKHLAGRHSWFLFGLISKSVIIKFSSLARSGIHRRDFLPDSFYSSLQRLAYNFGDFINKSILRRTNVELAGFINLNIAFLLRDLLSAGHRGFVFAIADTYYDIFQGDDHQCVEARLRFLWVLATHPHALALNLPEEASVANSRLIARLQESFGRLHFLAGLVLNQLKDSLHRASSIRILSFAFFRDLLWRHDHDENLNNDDARRRFAQIYFPLIPLVLDNSSLLFNPSATTLEERQTVAVSCMYILKNLSRKILKDWWCRDAQKRQIALLDLLTRCSECLHYVGADELRSKRAKEYAGLSFDILNQKLSLAATSRGQLSFRQHRASVLYASPLRTTASAVSGDDTDDSDSQTGASLSRAMTAMADSSKYYRDLVRRMRDPQSGLERKDRKKNFRTLKMSFIASDFVDWLIKEKEATTRELGVAIGEDMMEKHLIISLSDETTFKDNASLFRFQADVDTPKDKSDLDFSLPQEESEHQEFLEKYYSIRGDYPHPPPRVLKRKGWKMEQNLGREVTLTILDILLHFAVDHKQELLRFMTIGSTEPNVLERSTSGKTSQEKLSTTPSPSSDGTAPAPGSIGNGTMIDSYFQVLIECFKRPQTRAVMHLCFTVLNYLLPTFGKALFKQRNAFIGDLVYEILKECNSKCPKTRSEAASTILSLFTCNLMEVGRLSRMRLSTATAISRMFGAHLQNPSEADFANMKTALKAISIFAQGNLTMSTADGVIAGIEVKDIVDRLFSLIDNNIRVEKYSFDPYTRADYYYKMSMDYLDSPDLRITQLDKLASLHEKNGSPEAAAVVNILAAALVAEYLRLIDRAPPYFPAPSAFVRCFPSILSELVLPARTQLSVLGNEICQGVQFTEVGFINYLHVAIKNFLLADLFESAVEAYGLMLPVFMSKRDYEQQGRCYAELKQLCASIAKQPTRLFALYYRVLVFAPGITDLGEVHKMEFVYKTPATIRLAEFKETLKQCYERKLGAGMVEFLSNVKAIEESELQSGKIHMQVVSVDPYFSAVDAKDRSQPYLRHFDANQFIYETPFTRETGVAYTEDPSKQWKRKTILELQHALPFITTRVAVKGHKDIELSPIETATETILAKVQALQNELGYVLDLKTLAIQLHGTLLTQVNAGPLAIAKIFLSPEARDRFNIEHRKALQATFVQFVQLLANALSRQKPIIDTSQLAVQQELERAYFLFKEDVCGYCEVPQDIFVEGFVSPSQSQDDSLPSFLLGTESSPFLNSSLSVSPNSSPSTSSSTILQSRAQRSRSSSQSKGSQNLASSPSTIVTTTRKSAVGFPSGNLSSSISPPSSPYNSS